MEVLIVNLKVLTVFYVSIQKQGIFRGGIMKITLLFFVLLLLAFPAPVRAAFYQWVDAQGVTHFTDDPNKIPSRYQKRAKKLKMSEESAPAPAAAKSQPSPEAAQQAAEPMKPAPALVLGGHPEEWWREHFSALRTELKNLQDGLADKQAKLVALRRKRAIYTRAQDREAVNGMQDGISADELRISQLQSQISELEGQAARADVPVPWRQ
jgi:hypothetical protein